VKGSRRRATGRPTAGIVGLGYMGLATAVGFCERGIRVTGYDVLARRRQQVASGRSPFHEPGLPQRIAKHVRSGRFRVAPTLAGLVSESEIIFLCLPTPGRPSGQVDLAPLRRAIGELRAALVGARGYRLVVVKSTVPPGTVDEVVEPRLRRGVPTSARTLGVASNPEFLAEGSAVADAVQPERIVVGVSDRRSRRLLERLYTPFECPVHVLTPAGAELVKYSSNAFLALKVSFANEIAAISEKIDADIDDVMDAVGADGRIGRRFLAAGPGFGGSCFTKDLRALLYRSHQLGVPFRTGESALAANDDRAPHCLRLIRAALRRPMKGARVALLGLTFKEGTDDIRESRAFPILRELLSAGAQVRVHDPVAGPSFRAAWEKERVGGGSEVVFCRSVPEAVRQTDVAVLQVGWPEYVRWRTSWTRLMREPTLVDLRRAIPRRTRRSAGLKWVGLGVGRTTPPIKSRGTLVAPRGGRPRRS
jgi:UDPglucose 6-dehydrogenase